ncbi:MAG: pyruvate formate lyase-activating protein [Clostridia bacterium]|nr:pyruvate formate lyase-activating protein [Clostridia bacterium]
MTGYVHSIQSLGTLDGPGVRAVIFTTGCPLRCIYCHNPDTWKKEAGEVFSSSELAEKVLKLYPYIKNGGVTFSGGEPCVQAKFVTEVAKILKARGLHIALDTSGAVDNEDTDKLLELVDLVLLDVKFTSSEAYKLNTGADLAGVLRFLEKLEALGKDVWIRHVVVPGINDTEEDIRALSKILEPYKCIKKTELLPFRKLCLEKYEKLGIPFPLRDTPEAEQKRISELEELLKR